MTDDNRWTDDERLSAWLDGELPRDEADRLTARLAEEPALAARLEALRAADPAARRAFEAVDERPLPPRVLDLLEAGTDAAPRRADARADHVVPFPLRVLQSFLQAPVAVAASLALAVGFFASRQPGPGGAPAAGLEARVVPAGSALHDLLETGVGTGARPLDGSTSGRVLLTFEDTAGDYCRQARLADDTASMQAVACRRGGRWQVEVASFGAPAAPDAPYQAASPDTPPAVSAAIDGLIGGAPPLDADAERRLVDSAWKKIDE